MWTGRKFCEVQRSNIWLVCLEQRRNLPRYCFYVLEEMLEQDSQQVSSCGQLSCGPTSCPLSPSLLEGPQTQGHGFCHLHKQLSAWLSRVLQAWRSALETVRNVCAAICVTGRNSIPWQHTCLHAQVCVAGVPGGGCGSLPSCRMSSSPMKSYWQYEIKNLWVWNAKSNSAIYTSCEQLAIDSSIFHTVQTKAVEMAAGTDS